MMRDRSARLKSSGPARYHGAGKKNRSAMPCGAGRFRIGLARQASMEQFHGTTVLSVRRAGKVALGSRRTGDARQYRHQGRCAQGAAALSRPHPRRLRRRHGRRVHVVRAVRSEAREAPGQSRRARRWSSRRTGAPIGFCDASKRCWQSPTAKARSSSPVPATCSSPSRA